MKKMNNKGFSLVELIIVIAIMAVLIGVLAPVYLKHVEDSKVSADLQNAQQLATALGVRATSATGLATATATNPSPIFGTNGLANFSITTPPTIKAKGHANDGWFYSYDDSVEGDTIGIYIGNVQVYPDPASGSTWDRSGNNNNNNNSNNNSGNNNSGTGTQP